jgi:hypothetical protein
MANPPWAWRIYKESLATRGRGEKSAKKWKKQKATASARQIAGGAGSSLLIASAIARTKANAILGGGWRSSCTLDLLARPRA